MEVIGIARLVHEILDEAVCMLPRKTAIISNDAEISYRQLQDSSRRLAVLLAQIHRRDDYAAAERAIGAREGDGPGTIWGRGGPVSVFSCRGETL